jgi:hypothetical protein
MHLPSGGITGLVPNLGAPLPEGRNYLLARHIHKHMTRKLQDFSDMFLGEDTFTNFEVRRGHGDGVERRYVEAAQLLPSMITRPDGMIRTRREIAFIERMKT